MGAFRISGQSLAASLWREKAVFGRPSPHRKFPFPALAETRFDDCVVGPQFEPYCLHHLVFRARTSLALIAFNALEWGLFAYQASLWTSLCGEKRPFLAARLRIGNFRSRRWRRLGSMTAWWVLSSSPTASTT